MQMNQKRTPLHTQANSVHCLLGMCEQQSDWFIVLNQGDWSECNKPNVNTTLEELHIWNMTGLKWEGFINLTLENQMSAILGYLVT